MVAERYFFVHMQKTAGTSLFRMFQDQFGADAVYPSPEDGDPVTKVIDNAYLRQQLAKRPDAIRVVTGHFPLATVDLLDGSWRTLTVLREPVARTLSFLRHQQKVDPSRSGQSFEQIYDDPMLFDGLIHNHMVKMLSLSADNLAAAGVLTKVDFGEPDLERALDNLGKIDVVGLQEDLDDFVLRLNTTFGWSLGPTVLSNTTEPSETPLALVERIKSDNDLDCRLYEAAADQLAT